MHHFLFCTITCTAQIWGSGFEPGIKTSCYRWSDATNKSPADNASKILTIEFLFCLPLDLFCLPFGNSQCANAGFGFGLVLVWFVVSVPVVSGAVRIPCSQLGIAILSAMHRNSPDNDLSGEFAILRITLAADLTCCHRPHHHSAAEAAQRRQVRPAGCRSRQVSQALRKVEASNLIENQLQNRTTISR